MATENQWKHLEFTLALSKRLSSLLIENIRMGFRFDYEYEIEYEYDFRI